MQGTKTIAAFVLPQLPYGESALEPVISARTITFRYGKHHAGYVNALNKLVDGTAFAKSESPFDIPADHRCVPL